MSFHSRQSFSVNFHVILGLPGPCLPSTGISHAVLIAPFESSTCRNQRSLLSLKIGQGPPAQALPVAHLTSLWPHPLIFKVFLKAAKSYTPWRPYFLTNQICFSYFLESHLSLGQWNFLWISTLCNMVIYWSLCKYLILLFPQRWLPEYL